MKKICICCNLEWPLIYFYKHKKMKDGHLNKCKGCCKKHTKENRLNNYQYYKKYEKQRSKTKKRLDSNAENTKKWRINNPEKYKAHNKLNNSLRDKKINKEPCLICGDPKVQAHHEDYNKPLDVMWLCSLHHKAIHK